MDDFQGVALAPLKPMPPMSLNPVPGFVHWQQVYMYGRPFACVTHPHATTHAVAVSTWLVFDVWPAPQSDQEAPSRHARRCVLTPYGQPAWLLTVLLDVLTGSLPCALR